MPIGAYLGAGSVKLPPLCYQGVGNACRTTTGIYIGQNNVVKQVWPPYIYNEGTFSSMGDGMQFASYGSNYYPQVNNESTYIQLLFDYRYANWTTGMAGAYCNSAIDVSSYKALTMTFTVPQIPSSSTVSQAILGGCTEQPSFGSDSYKTMRTRGTDYQTQFVLSSATSTTAEYTLSLDVSSVSVPLYVYVGCRNTSSSYSPIFEAHVSHIEISA